jgi:hypothetical protein
MDTTHPGEKLKKKSWKKSCMSNPGTRGTTGIFGKDKYIGMARR